MSAMKVWIISCLVLLSSAVHQCTDAPSDSFESFDFEQLRKYTAIVDCMAQIYEQFAHCNRMANETGTQFITDYKVKNIHDLPDHVRCCGLIALTDCWLSAAKVKCRPEDRQKMTQIPYLVIPQLMSDCSFFLNRPDKCRTNFNLWHILTFLLVIPIMSFAFISLIIVCCCRHKYSYLRDSVP